MHAQSDLTLPCYCSAAAKNRSACTDCSAAENSRFVYTELLSSPELPTNRAPARFELELPCYCSSAAAKSRFSCTDLLSGPALPTERVYARFELNLPHHRSAATISRFFCMELLNLLLILLTLGCSESLWVVLNVTCDTLTSLDSVVAASNRTGACLISFDTATVLLLRRIALPALKLLFLALGFQPNGGVPNLS